MSPPYQVYPREQYNRYQQHEQQQQVMKWGSGWMTAPSSSHPPTQFRFGSREGFTTPPPPSQSMYHHPFHHQQQQQRGSVVCSPSPQIEQRPSAFLTLVYPQQQSQQQQPPLVNNNMKKKKVTFKETCTVRTHNNNTPSTPTEKSNLYYTRQELKIMTLEAHAICILSQELPQSKSEGTLLTKKDRRRSGTFYDTNDTDDNTTGPKVKRRSSWLGLNEDQDTTATNTATATSSSNNNGSSIMLDSIRGLELILYTKRKQNKILANRSLLKYQQLLQSKDYLSTERKVQALAVANVKLTTWSKLVALETARLDALRAYDSDYLIPIEPLEGEDGIMPFPYYKKVEDRVSEKYQEQHNRRQGHMKRRLRESYRRVTFDSPTTQGYDGSIDSGKRRKTESRLL
eukprot:926288_1